MPTAGVILYLMAERMLSSYCSRPLTDQPEKVCKDIGALLKYMDKVNADPIRKEYHRAYKRNHSRLRVSSMTQTEFLEWSDEAQEKRDQCLAGEIDIDEFMEWINQDRRYEKRK